MADNFQMPQSHNRQFQQIINYTMGGNFCGVGNHNFETERLKALFGEDPKEKDIDHPLHMKFLDENLETKLGPICDKLYDNRTMYKDPTMSTDPILLRTEKNQMKCTFQRPYEFMKEYPRGKEVKIVDNFIEQPEVIEVNDEIMQYFGVFLCFLADKPKLINQIIQTQSNTYGLHCVSAYVNGMREDIIIDDYFLCHNDVPTFSQPCRNLYIWPLILEKAWLKIRGSFDHRFEQSTPEEVFDTFLRFPIHKISLQNESRQATENKVKKYLSTTDEEKGYILTSKKNPLHKLGISGRKNFYLIGAFTHENKILFYVRNPHPHKFTFRGYYSNLDDFEEIREIIKKKYRRIDPGNFVLDFEEFTEQFSEISIVHFIWGNKVKSQKFEAEDGQEVFVGVQLDQNGGDLTLSLEQYASQYSEEDPYSPITYQVVKLPQRQLVGGLENDEGCFGAQSISLIDKKVIMNASGKYLVRLKKKQLQKKTLTKTFIVGSYRSQLKFTLPIQEQLQEQWKQFLMSIGEKELEKYSLKKKKQGWCHVVCWLADIAFIYIKKLKEKPKMLKLEVNFENLQNLECISHPEIKKSDEFKVLKLEDTVLIIFEKIDLTAETHINKYHLQAF